MKPIFIRLFTGLLLLTAAQVFGQTLTTNFVVTQPAAGPYPIGTHIVVEMRVTGFSNIESMQFPITYNKDALRFDSLTNSVFSNWIYPPSLASNSQSLPTQGRIGISWLCDLGNNPTGCTLAGNTTIFKLHFTAIANGVSAVNMTNVPGSSPSIPMEFARQGTGPLANNQINFQSGGASLTLGTGNPPPPPLVGFKIVANPIQIPAGERTCMPLTVNDFDNIIAMQFILHWDNTVMNFECAKNFNLPSWSANDFALFAPNPGTLVVKWDDPTLAGVTRADGARIADICFKSVAPAGGQTPITINGQGGPQTFGDAEAYNANSVNVWSYSGANGASGVSAQANIYSSPSASSVTYTADKDTLPSGQQTCVDIKVKNFSNMTSSEFVIAYNPQKLTYSSAQFGSNPLGLVAANVTVAAVPTPTPAVHYIKFTWSNTSGVTVPNDGTIFSLCFNNVQPNEDSTNIRFLSTQCSGIGNSQLNTGGVPMLTNNGWVKAKISGPPINVTNVSCNGGNNGTASVSNLPGLTAQSYSWTGPGIVIGTNNNVQNPSGLTAGTYAVTVTYTNGSTGTNTAIISQPAQPLSQTNAVNTVSCFGGTNGAINLTPAGGTSPYSFTWSTGATTEDLLNINTGIYTVTIKDANNCTLGPINITVNGATQIQVPNGNVSITNTSCTGNSNGSIAINPNGGAGNYTYDWSHNGAQTPDTDPKDLVNMPAGTYTVTITDANGCSVIVPANGLGYTIAAPQALVSSVVSKTDVKCINTPSGAITINVTGGTGNPANMSYSWANSGGTVVSMSQNPNNLPAGTYSLTVTDQATCTSTHVQGIVIANAPAPLMLSNTTQPSPCFDTPSGSIDLNVVGGWSNYTYSWSGSLPAVQDPPAGAVAPGTYTVTVTDGNGCTATNVATVAGASQISINPAIQHVTCFGQGNGGINLNVAGGTPNGSGDYNVAWNGGLSGESIGNLAPGLYQPIVTDNAGCTKSFPAIQITGPDELIISTNITPANPSGNIDLTIVSGGTPNFSYSWTGPNGFTSTNQDISAPAGDYVVVVKDANNCERTFNLTIPSGNVLISGGISAITNACDHDGCIFLSMPQTASAQLPLTVNWGFGSAQFNTISPQICDLAAGVYSLTVTAANGNTLVLNTMPAGGPIQVMQSDPASANIMIFNPFANQQNGKIILEPGPGVQGTLIYNWGPPLNTTGSQVSNLDSGLYVVTITNTNSGCTAVEEIHLERQYATLSTSTTNVVNPVCAAAATGAISITVNGGATPYTYNWVGPNGFTSTDEDLVNLNPGFYSLTVTDGLGSNSTSTYTLTAQSNLNITNVNETSLYPSGHQVSGAAVCNGVAAVVFTPGVGATSILWSNGVTTANNTTLCGGDYSVTVTDGAGCSVVWADELTAPDAISIEQEAEGVKCFSDCNGTAKVFVEGGIQPYDVRWSTGQFDQSVFAGQFSQAVNLCGGDYTVTITDKNGVTMVQNVNVPQPVEITVELGPTAPRNFNACDGLMVANISGAAQPITYLWSSSFHPTSTNERYEGLCAGEAIAVSITDANGCSVTASDSIPYPEDGCFRLSPVLTPGQQDGKNDFVVVTCIESAISNRLEIYNRWGQIVFETDGYTNNDSDREHNWNGLTKSGDPLAEGVYYYVLYVSYIDDLGQQHDEQRKGAINLLR